MKAKWTSIIDDLRGNVDSRHYARRIPGNDEWAAICEKPELSKKTKKKKAEHPTAQSFKNALTISHSILRDTERRAIWQARYDEAKHKAHKHKKSIHGRLCDFVKHEVSLALQNGEEIA